MLRGARRMRLNGRRDPSPEDQHGNKAHGVEIAVRLIESRAVETKS